MKILRGSHIVILSITANFYESRAYSKFIQIIVRTNILPNTSRIKDPFPSVPELLQRSMDSDNNYKASHANVPPSIWNQLTYLHSAEEELTSLMRSSWNLTWRAETADNCSDSSIEGGNYGSSTISSADSVEHESSWIWGAGWDVDAGPGSCTSESASVEPTVLRWSPWHCIKTPAYKNKPKMSFGSIMVC